MTIIATDQGAVRTLTMNRPHRMNALDVSTMERLTVELAAARDDRSIGAVVLTGAGKHFCAGGDVESVLDAIDDTSDDAITRLMGVVHRAVQAVWHNPLPIVAAVSGVAYGGGFNLALACDLVMCSRGARFSQVYVRRGVVPDLGGAFLLPRLVGMQRAKELVLLADEIDAEHAQRLGLVTEVLPTVAETLAHAQKLAARLAEHPRFALAQAKKLLNASTAGSFDSALDLEATMWAAVLPSARPGFDAFRKR